MLFKKLLIVIFLCLPLEHSLLQASAISDSKSVYLKNIHPIISIDAKTKWQKYRFSNNNKFLALLSKRGQFALIDISTGKIKQGSTGSNKNRYFNFSPDSSELWIIDNKGTLERHTPDTAKRIEETTRQGQAILWRPNTNHSSIEIISTAPFNFSLKTKKENKIWTDFKGRVVLNAKSHLLHNNETIILARSANDVLFWSAKDPLAQLKTNNSYAEPPLASLACNGSCVITSEKKSSEKSYLWYAPDKHNKHYELDGRVYLDRTSVGEPLLTTNGTGNKLAYYKSTTLGIFLLTTDGFKNSERTVNLKSLSMARFSDNGKYLVIKSSNQSKLDILNGDTLERFLLPPFLDQDQSNAIISPSARSLVALGNEGEAVLIILDDKITYKVLNLDLIDASFSYSPKGRWLTVTTIGGRTIIYDSKTGEAKYIFDKHQNISSLLFSPNEKYLSIIDKNGKLQIFNSF